MKIRIGYEEFKERFFSDFWKLHYFLRGKDIFRNITDPEFNLLLRLLDHEITTYRLDHYDYWVARNIKTTKNNRNTLYIGGAGTYFADRPIFEYNKTRNELRPISTLASGRNQVPIIKTLYKWLSKTKRLELLTGWDQWDDTEIPENFY